MVTNWEDQVDGLVDDIETMRKHTTHRKIIAVAGPPASGKTTLAQTLADRLNNCSYLSLDGFHLDNSILIKRGLRNRKGSPETFDVNGFADLLRRLEKKEEIFVPAFDRDTERAINCAYPIPYHDDLVIVEGNYLLLDEPIWRDLSDYWNLTVFLELDLRSLKRRLTKRWIAQGFDEQEAEVWIETNDLPNAHRVLRNRIPEDITLSVRG